MLEILPSVDELCQRVMFFEPWQNREHNHLKRGKFMQTQAFLWSELEVAQQCLGRKHQKGPVRHV